jgi:Transposase, Mutator family
MARLRWLGLAVLVCTRIGLQRRHVITASTHQCFPRRPITAYGVAADGRREVLGFQVGDSEDGALWAVFLRSLNPAAWRE